VRILSTDSDELGNTTRHFILYGEFIFKLTLFDTNFRNLRVCI
jgi:hypothetical protein